MAQISDSIVTDIADAIREKEGSSECIKPVEMPEKVSELGTFMVFNPKYYLFSGDPTASASLLPNVGNTISLPAKGELGTNDLCICIGGSSAKGPYPDSDVTWPCPWNPFGISTDDLKEDLTITINGSSQTVTAPLGWVSDENLLYLNNISQTFPTSISQGYTGCALLDFGNGKIRYGMDRITSLDWDDILTRLDNDNFPTITQQGNSTGAVFNTSGNYVWFPLGYFDSTTAGLLNSTGYQVIPIFNSSLTANDINKLGFCGYNWRPYCDQTGMFWATKMSSNITNWSSSKDSLNQWLIGNDIPGTIETGISFCSDPSRPNGSYNVWGIYIGNTDINSSDRATLLGQVKTVVTWLKNINLQFLQQLGGWESRTIDMPVALKALYDNATGPITLTISGAVAGGVRIYQGERKGLEDYNIANSSPRDIEEWMMEHGMDPWQDSVMWLQPKDDEES